MATLSFSAIPADLDVLDVSEHLRALFQIDGPLSADATTITAMTTYNYFTVTPDIGYFDQLIDIEITGSFSYHPLATVSGTVDTVTLSAEGSDLMTIAGIDGDAAAIWLALSSGRKTLATLLSGDDSLTGTDGDDRLVGRAGNDILNGLDGTDRLFGNSGDDIIRGGGGNDTVNGDRGKDLLRGNDGADSLDGGIGKDRLFGGEGGDKLYGDNGDDSLFGGAGNDSLYGDNVINPDGGNDRLQGGEGDDRFVFSRFGDKGGTGADTITDFETNDEIRLGMVNADVGISLTQLGDDVLIVMADASTGSEITVLDATLAEVEAAIETSPWLLS